MGQTGSSVVKKLGNWWTASEDGQQNVTGRELAISPFVFKRRGSMYMDEEGDMAHEFYEEVVVGKSRRRIKMRRKKNNLQPQGDVELPHPRLHWDFPVVLCEAPSS